jgi:hypothetical protein
MPPERLEHLFMVRIWEEADRSESKQWRGLVEHIPSCQRLYFSSLADLNDFINWRLHIGATCRGEEQLTD